MGQAEGGAEELAEGGQGIPGSPGRERRERRMRDGWGAGPRWKPTFDTKCT